MIVGLERLEGLERSEASAESSFVFQDEAARLAGQRKVVVAVAERRGSVSVGRELGGLVVQRTPLGDVPLGAVGEVETGEVAEVAKGQGALVFDLGFFAGIGGDVVQGFVAGVVDDVVQAGRAQ